MFLEPACAAATNAQKECSAVLRELQTELRFSYSICDRDAAAMGHHDGFGDGQAQASALR
jgi:hypothetical protein